MGSRKTPDTWAGTVKAIGIKALTAGKFWQFCFVIAFVFWCRQIDSADWVKIADIALSSRAVAAMGWILSLFIVLGSGLLIRFMRTFYLGEIARVTGERNRLQDQLAGTAFSSSKLQPSHDGMKRISETVGKKPK